MDCDHLLFMAYVNDGKSSLITSIIDIPAHRLIGHQVAVYKERHVVPVGRPGPESFEKHIGRYNPSTTEGGIFIIQDVEPLDKSLLLMSFSTGSLYRLTPHNLYGNSVLTEGGLASSVRSYFKATGRKYGLYSHGSLSYSELLEWEERQCHGL